MKRLHLRSTLLAGACGLAIAAQPCLAGECPWDLSPDGEVNAADLAVLLGQWGAPYGPADLANLLGAWGPCETGEKCSPTLSQSVDMNVSTGDGIACNNGADNLVTGIARSYAVTDYTVCTVELGFDNLATVARTVTLNLHDDTDGGGPGAGLVLLHTEEVTVDALFVGVIQVVLATPITHTGTLVVEIVIPTSTEAAGALFSGCNFSGDSSSAWIIAPDCGAAVYASWASLGLTNNWAQSLNGEGLKPGPQACCFADETCDDMLAADCTAFGGTPQGAGSECATADCTIPELCGPDAGDCCIPNGTPGCNVPTCCESICGADPFCCDTEWDQICADAAAADPNCTCP